MRTGLTRYDVSTTLLDIVETIDHSSDYFANERDASCPFEFFKSCPFLTFLRVDQGYVDREKRESRLWLNSFWLNYSDFIVGFVVTL